MSDNAQCPYAIECGSLAEEDSAARGITEMAQRGTWYYE